MYIYNRKTFTYIPNICNTSRVALGRGIARCAVQFHQLGFECFWGVPESGGVGIKRRLVIWFAKERLQRQKNGVHAINCRPFILQNI